MARQMPSSTYRVQLHKNFNFEDALEIVDYLHALGITDFYISPIFEAKQGSLHGYDLVNPQRLNPELGTHSDFTSLVGALQEKGMGLLLDIVVNHMAANFANPCWRDLLENGQASRYADYFDIHWETSHRIHLPVLEAPYEVVLRQGKFSIIYEQALGFCLAYAGERFPIDPKTYILILAYAVPPARLLALNHADARRQFQEILDQLEFLPPTRQVNRDAQIRRHAEKKLIKEKLGHLYADFSIFRQALDAYLQNLNHSHATLSKANPMHRLLSAQPYRLLFWKEAEAFLNYRRFFIISDLVGVREENPDVFEYMHHVLLQLIHDGMVTGLRIDHIDGLYDPTGYLIRLQARLAKDPFYIVVEKILLGNETLPHLWPVSGSTGYDVIRRLNDIFISPEGLVRLDEIYKSFTGERRSFSAISRNRREWIMRHCFQPEVNELIRQLQRLAITTERKTGVRFSRQSLEKSLISLTVNLNVYRTYIRDLNVSKEDRLLIEEALILAKESFHERSAVFPALTFLGKVLLLRSSNPQRRKAYLDFVMRWQQVTGPVMAKGIEDTAFYVYNRLLSLNEVGNIPTDKPTSDSVAAFHRYSEQKRLYFPGGLNTSSTHDTKRSEDVNARLNVLSEIPLEWGHHLSEWHHLNRGYKRPVGAKLAPSSNEEVLLYQVMLGAWPLQESEISTFLERLAEFTVKALREAKVNSRWRDPDEDYEQAVIAFLQAIFDDTKSKIFLSDFKEFASRIAFYGAINSLCALVLKLCAPGIPDIYQGMELWEFTLVDPDNRRPIDYEHRKHHLTQIQKNAAPVTSDYLHELLSQWQDGRIKLYVTTRTLHLRKRYSFLFRQGHYYPLSASTNYEHHVVAFARKEGRQWAVVATPRFSSALSASFPIGASVWRDGRLYLPPEAPQRWRHAYTDDIIESETTSERTSAPQARSNSIPLGELFLKFPVTLLVSV